MIRTVSKQTLAMFAILYKLQRAENILANIKANRG